MPISMVNHDMNLIKMNPIVDTGTGPQHPKLITRGDDIESFHSIHLNEGANSRPIINKEKKTFELPALTHKSISHVLNSNREQLDKNH